MSESAVAYRIVENAENNCHTEVDRCSGPDELGNCPAVRKGDEVPCAGLNLKPLTANGAANWQIIVPKESVACPIPAIKSKKWSFRTLGFLTVVAGFLAGAGTATGWTLGLYHPTTTTASKPVHASMIIATPDMLGTNVGPAFIPSDLTLPANSTVTITVIDFDSASALPAQFATARGIIGALSIQPLDPTNPNAKAAATSATSLDPNTGVAHTFTIDSLGINVPIAPQSKTTFTIHTGKAGTYKWRCYDPCGTDPGGWGGAMATKGYMEGTVTPPPMCSLPSAKGPSNVSTSPFWTRRTVAVLEGCKSPGEHPYAGGLHLLVQVVDVSHRLLLDLGREKLSVGGGTR